MTMQEEAQRADAGCEPVAAKPTQGPDASARDNSTTLPDDVLCIVPVRNVVLFPGIVMPLSLGRPKSIAATGNSLTRAAGTPQRIASSRR